jgi:hypothetical protein
MLKKYSHILILILLLGTSSVAFAQTKTNSLVDNAINFVSDVGLTAVFKSISAINFLIGYIGGILVFLGGNLANWALNLNSQIIQSPTVQVGWVITRDLANLGFVLAIILIAFATILRVESYQMKQTLRNLIIAALLINFSLVIAGVFIDFSGVLTEFFISKATGGDLSKMGSAFANAFQVQKFLQTTKDANAIDKLVTGLSGISIVPFAASLFFVALFTIVAAIALFGLAAMLFIRYIMLSILLVLMPLAWLMWIWPDLQGKWKEWWGEFFKWVWFAPILSFFIYLALNLASSKYQGELALGGAGDVLNPGNSLGLIIDNAGQIIGQMIAVLGVLFGGLAMAQRMGIYGADVTMGFAQGAKNMAIGAITAPGRAAGRFAGRAAGAAAGEVAGAMGGGRLNEFARRATARLSKAPLVGGAFAEYNRELIAGEEKRMDELQKGFASTDKDTRLNRLTSTYDPTARAALMATFADKGELKDAKEFLTKQYGSERGERMYDEFAKLTVDRGGKFAKQLIAKDPTTAKWTVKTEPGVTPTATIIQQRKAAIAKAITSMAPEGIESVSMDLLATTPEYLSALKGNHVSRLADRSIDDKKRLTDAIKEQLKKVPASPDEQNMRSKIKTIAQQINKNPAWAGFEIELGEPKETQGQTQTQERKV